ncbi:hypothetical protein LIER_14936 [Lithospermum erythrorhizon]|uniref:Uncharacterized protein n=1 Tax=Lithospermum erythrorhizon TaxID=34254 RepID=A0AAV3Q2H0_LITER
MLLQVHEALVLFKVFRGVECGKYFDLSIVVMGAVGCCKRRQPLRTRRISCLESLQKVEMADEKAQILLLSRRIEERALVQRAKRIGERGSPCLRPRLVRRETELFQEIEKKVSTNSIKALLISILMAAMPCFFTLEDLMIWVSFWP